MHEKNPLHNRAMHISGIFKETEKPDIQTIFSQKTAKNIIKLQKEFSNEKIFGRTDLIEMLNIKPSRASELIKQMLNNGIIEPVSGYGKGKYRFR